MALTKEESKKLDETHGTVIELKTAICGANGKGGLLDRVEELAKGHSKLKRSFWVLVGILIGSGAIAGSIIQAVNSG